MESAKVFDSMMVATTHHAITITIYASLVFWRRDGSPQFRTIKKITVPNGVYNIQYVGKAGEAVLLQRLRIMKHEIIELNANGTEPVSH